MITTELINHSSKFRKVNNDDKKHIKAVVIGLSYNKNELCRVFSDRFSNNS